MIQIHNITNKDIVEKIIIECDLECAGDEKYLGIFDGENIVGFAQFVYYSDTLRIKFISFEFDDFSLSDALMKTLFYYADLHKMNYLFLPSSLSKYSEYLNFQKVDNGYILNLNELQTEIKCKCRKD